jgi:ATP-dependent RNA circularization protein (DNA/RNA ligase family)
MIEFPEELIKQKLKEAEEDRKWFIENKRKLREKYSNLFIAIANKQVIATSKNVEELVKKLRENNQEDALIEFIEPEDTIVVY